MLEAKKEAPPSLNTEGEEERLTRKYGHLYLNAALKRTRTLIAKLSESLEGNAVDYSRLKTIDPLILTAIAYCLTRKEANDLLPWFGEIGAPIKRELREMQMRELTVFPRKN